MKYNIHIDRMKVFAHHGVMEQERTLGAEFFVTLNAEVQVEESAYIHDRIEGTVSYADIVTIINNEMQQPSNLLEHVAWRIATRLQKEYSRITSICLRIDKQNPPCGASADAIGVEIKL